MDLQKIAASFYNTIKKINSAAVETVGIDVLWARAIPYENSEDVIIQEYTLHSVECPRALRVVTNKNDYDPGTFNVEMFGIVYEQPFEITVDIERWEETYGKGTMPQKDDIVYVHMLHRLYEVKSSTMVCSVGQMPVGYKAVLGKYVPTASRKENEHLLESIQDLTVSQNELFGEAISGEIADITDCIDFGQHNTDSQDTFKECEFESILNEELLADGNCVGYGRYDFALTTKPIAYNAEATYYRSGKRNKWLYTCWFMLPESGLDPKPVKDLRLYNKTRQEYTFSIKVPGDFAAGEEITIRRGSLLSVTGKITEKRDDKYMMSVSANMVLRANKKLTGWWSTSGWTVDATSSRNFIKGYGEDGAEAFDITLKDGAFGIAMCNVSKQLKPDVPNGLPGGEWLYLAVAIGQKSMRAYIRRIRPSASGSDTELLAKAEAAFAEKIGTFAVKSFAIDNAGLVFGLRNIRLYECEHDASDDQLLLDSQSRYPRNSSKIIISDMPALPNEMRYVGSAK